MLIFPPIRRFGIAPWEKTLCRSSCCSRLRRRIRQKRRGTSVRSSIGISCDRLLHTHTWRRRQVLRECGVHPTVRPPSGRLPTRPTRSGLGAPKARGPPRLGGPKVGGPQSSPAQWPQRTGAQKAWKSPRVGAPRICGPHGLGAPWAGGTQGLGPPWVGGRKGFQGAFTSLNQ
jgi:hypothetical protein